MKKVLIISVLVLCFFGIVSADLGKNARLTSLGGFSLMVPDSETMLDPYSNGFTSGYVLRDKKSFISISPGLKGGTYRKEYKDPSYSEMNDELLGFTLDRNDNDPDTGLTVWFSDDNLLRLTPYFMNYVQDSAGSLATLGFSAICGEYAHRFSDIFSLGLLFSYNSFMFNSDYKDDNDFQHIDINKIAYQLSGTFINELENGFLSFSFSGGNARNVFPYEYLELELIAFPVAERLVVVDVFSYQEHYKYDDGDPTHYYETEGSTSVNGFITNIGFDFVNRGVFELSSKLGVIAGVKGVRETEVKDYFGTDKYPAYDNYADGLTLDTALKMRIYIADVVILGASYQGINGGCKKAYSASDTPFDNTWNEMRIKGGITFMAGKNFLLPLEFVKEYFIRTEDDTDSYSEATYDAMVLKAGAEYTFDSGFALRAGVKVGRGGTTSYYEDDYYTSGLGEKSYGTADNPAYGLLGFSGGLGYKNSNFELNAGFIREALTQEPMDSELKLFESSSYSIVTDIKVMF